MYKKVGLRKVWLLALSALLVLSMAAGCAGRQEAKPKGVPTLIEGTYGDVETMDPQKATGIGTMKLSFLLYDTLTSLDYDFKVHPGLAESWEVSPDQLTYTFHLKKGVKFHSGKEFTSADVKYTFERWLDPNTASPTAYRVKNIQEIQTPDPYTVVIKLKAPSRTFLSDLAGGFASILNKEAVEKLGPDYGIKGVDGTGPFKLVSWDRNQQIVLERFEDYRWGPPFYSNKGPAKIAKLIIKVIPEGQTRMMAVEKGEIDLAIHQTPFVEAKRLMNSDSVTVMPYEPLLSRYIGFKVTRPTLSDPAVRKAINYAIDKQAICDTVYLGFARPAKGPISEKAYGYWPGVEQIAYSYDPAKAKQILEEAGWKVGPDGYRRKGNVTLKDITIYALPYYEKDLTMVQANLKEIGIGVVPKLLDVPALFPALKQGQHDMYFMNFPYETGDILYEYFHSSCIPAPNRHDWKDPETDRLLDTWRTSTDEQEALNALADVQKIILEQALWVPMYHMSAVNVVNKSTVRNYRPYPVYDVCLHKLLDVESSRLTE